MACLQSPRSYLNPNPNACGLLISSVIKNTVQFSKVLDRLGLGRMAEVKGIDVTFWRRTASHQEAVPGSPLVAIAPTTVQQVAACLVRLCFERVCFPRPVTWPDVGP